MIFENWRSTYELKNNPFKKFESLRQICNNKYQPKMETWFDSIISLIDCLPPKCLINDRDSLSSEKFDKRNLNFKFRGFESRNPMHLEKLAKFAKREEI